MNHRILSGLFPGRRSPSTAAGYTLIEVLIALSILSIGFLAVAKMQTMSVMGNSHAMEMTEGVTWGTDKLEELMGLDYDDAQLDPAAAHQQNPALMPEYDITWTVAADTPTVNTKQITVQVKWVDEYGNAKTVRLVGVKNQL